MIRKHTNCITNFSRLNHLNNAVKNLDKKSTVISSFGSTPDHSRVLESVARHYATEKDYGCNRLWMQAIAMAPTKYIVLHHDDDQRPVGHDSTLDGMIEAMERSGAGFGCWDGIQSFEDGRLGKRIHVGGTGSGPQYSTGLIPHVTKRGALPWSPISFVLRREDALDILAWCDTNLKECVTRPTMMIGNDTALVLGHARRYDRYFKYTGQPLSLYGHWDGSETCQFANGTNDALLRAYDKAKGILAGAIIPRRTTHRQFIHVTTHGPQGPNERAQKAMATWRTAYTKIEADNLIVPHYNPELPRTSKTTLNDVRPLAFIKDLIDSAAALAQPHDIICFSNDDVGVRPDAFKILIDHAEKYGAALTHRRDFFEKVGTKPNDIAAGRWHAGTDLVVFTKKWWDTYRSEFPDFIIGCEAWDWVMRILINKTTGTPGYKDLVWHEYHGSQWEKPGFRLVNISNVHNRRMAREWLIARGIYNGEFEPNSICKTGSIATEPEGI